LNWIVNVKIKSIWKSTLLCKKNVEGDYYEDSENQKYRLYLLKLNIGHLNEALKLIKNYKEYIKKEDKTYRIERLNTLVEDIKEELDFRGTEQSLNNKVMNVLEALVKDFLKEIA